MFSMVKINPIGCFNVEWCLPTPHIVHCTTSDFHSLNACLDCSYRVSISPMNPLWDTNRHLCLIAHTTHWFFYWGFLIPLPIRFPIPSLIPIPNTPSNTVLIPLTPPCLTNHVLPMFSLWEPMPYCGSKRWFERVWTSIVWLPSVVGKHLTRWAI